MAGHSTSGELNALLVTLVLLTGAATWIASLLTSKLSVSIFLIAGGLSLFVALLGTSLRNDLMSSIILGVSLL